MMSWHNRLFLFSFPPSMPPNTSIFTLNNTVISLKLGKTVRFSLHVGLWCSLVWKEMCSDFVHQYCSYWPRLIRSQPSGQALWENVAGWLLFGWLVGWFLSRTSHEIRTLRTRDGMLQRHRTTGNWEKSMHGVCKLLGLWYGGLNGLRRKQSGKNSHRSNRNGHPRCGWRGSSVVTILWGHLWRWQHGTYEQDPSCPFWVLPVLNIVKASSCFQR